MSPRKNYSQMYKEENDIRDEKEFSKPIKEEVEVQDNKKILDEVKEDDVMEKVSKVKKTKKKEGVVVGGSLNVRNNPNGDIVGSLSSGDVIEILEEVDGWYKIQNGYVMSKFVEVK